MNWIPGKDYYGLEDPGKAYFFEDLMTYAKSLTDYD